MSSTAKAKAEKRDDTAETNAANAECKKQQAADAAKFAQDYKNFGQCVKSQKGNDDSDHSVRPDRCGGRREPPPNFCGAKVISTRAPRRQSLTGFGFEPTRVATTDSQPSQKPAPPRKRLT